MSSLPIESIEQNRIQKQNNFDTLKSGRERNVKGLFATPPSLALEIAEYISDIWKSRKDKIRFLEPAFGTGSFYSALLQVFSKQIWEGATALEIDSELVEIARRVWSDYPIQIVQQDFTKAEPPTEAEKKFNLIVTNPPYVRHHHLIWRDKIRLGRAISDRLDISISGLSGLYCYFLLLADSWLAEGGLSVWLIPSEFMDVNYGSAIREYLTKRVSLVRIHRFSASDMQFPDAAVSSAIVVFVKNRPQVTDSISISLGGSLTKPNQIRKISIKQLSRLSKWNGTIFEEPFDSAVITLSSLFQIKRGIATGDNHFFIMSLDDARKRGIPASCIKPILPGPRELKENVIEADSNGFPQIERKLVVIDTHTPESEIKAKYPNFWKYLESGKNRRVDKTYLTSRRRPWYKQEYREPAPFLCSYMGRQTKHGKKPFRFFWNKSNAVAPNVYLLLYPKEPLKEELIRDSSLLPKVFEVLQTIDKDLMVDAGRVYGGGLHKLEPSELGKVRANELLDLKALKNHGLLSF
jgi:adenine-specific DNA-methyltransferase